MVPLLPALLVFFALVEGWKGLRRYTIVLGATGTALLAVVAATVDVEAMIFNTILIFRDHEVFAMRYLPEFSERVELPELPGWKVHVKEGGVDPGR